MKSLAKFFALGAVLAASSPLAFATTITPGNTAAATTLAYDPTSIVGSITGALTAGTFTGSYAEVVFYDADNIYNSQCGSTGCLTFVLQVQNNASSPNGLEHVSNGAGSDTVMPGNYPSPGTDAGFQYYSLNAGYATVGGGTAPITVDESLYGGTVEFNFTGGDAIAPGGVSDLLIIETNATAFTTGDFSAIDSSTASVEGFVPVAATPEPNSLLLLGTGLIGAAGLLFMRRRNAAELM